MKNITESTMKSRSIIIIVMILLVIQSLFITNSLWFGRAERNVYFEKQDSMIALNVGYKLDGAEPITQAELAQAYARDHILRYMIFETKKGWKSDREHWAGKQLDFFESVSNMKIIDPDDEATQDMAKVVIPGFKLEYTDTVYRNLIWEHQVVKRIISLGVIYGIALIMSIMFSKRSKMLVILNLLLLALSAICAVNIVGQIAFMAVQIYIILLAIKHKTIIFEGNEIRERLICTPILLGIIQIVMLFLLTWASNIIQGICFSALSIAAIWYYATKIWKPFWVPKKRK